MAAIKLSFAGSENVGTLPILRGDVQPDGIEFLPTVLDMPGLVRRQFESHEFDVSEFSISSLIIALSKGDDSFTALPIFPIRRFHHTQILVRVDAGIEKPEDLAGKRVGVPEYQQAAAVWIRGALQHEFGVSPNMMRWFMERLPERSHGGVTGFVPPPDVEFQYIPIESNIGEMMLSGELDAALVYMPDANLIDRSSADLSSAPEIRDLFPDKRAEEARYLQKTGICPTNHIVVIQRELAEQNPWMVPSIFNAFVEAKELTYPQSQEPDPLPYGVAGSRTTIETFAAYNFEQGLSRRLVAVEEMFHPATFDY